MKMTTESPAHSLASILPALMRTDSDYLRWLWTIATSEVLRQRPDKFCHFVRLAEIDVGEFRSEINETPEKLWSQYAARKQIAAHQETDSVPLRKAKVVTSPIIDSSRIHVHEDAETAYAKRYPTIMRYLNGFADSMCSVLSRALIVRLNSKCKVHAHFDAGYYYLVRDRYHLVINSPQGSRMRCMNDFSIWQEGQLWWFNNKVEHEAFNDGDSWRVHLIFDLLPKHLIPLMEQIKQLTPYYQQIATR